MNERRLELRVGVFALLAIGILTGLVLTLGRFTSKERFHIYVDFTYAGGIPAGAVVKIAGVNVGRVREVEFRPEYRIGDRAYPVRLHVDIETSAAPALASDAFGTIGQQGALGENYLEIIPGSLPERLENGATIRGLEPPRLDVVFARLYYLLDSATEDDVLRTFLVEFAHLARVVRLNIDEHEDNALEMFKGLGKLLANSSHILEDARIAAHRAVKILNDPAVNELIQDLGEVTRMAKTELPKITDNTHTLLARIDKLTQHLSLEDAQKMKELLFKADRLSISAEQIIDGIEKGEGTLGQLLKDPQVYEDLSELLSDLRANPWKLVWKR